MDNSCLVAIENIDGSVRAIKCSNDGHISMSGLALERYYNDTKVVNELLDLGWISNIFENPETIKLIDTTMKSLIPFLSEQSHEPYITYKNTEEYARQPQNHKYLFLPQYETWYVITQTKEFSIKMTKLTKLLLENTYVTDKDEIHALVRAKNAKKLYEKFSATVKPKNKNSSQVKI